jgi:hypothetical protein
MRKQPLYPGSGRLPGSNIGGNEEETAPAQQASGDDPNAEARFVDENDKIAADPSYTRSKMRPALKEQEVNSKMTWFNKLFRGGPATDLEGAPDEAGAREGVDEWRVTPAAEPSVPEALAALDGNPLHGTPEARFWDAPAPAPLNSPIASAQTSFAESSSPDPDPSWAPPSRSITQTAAHSRSQGRPSRPLTFHQLVSRSEAGTPHEAPHEAPNQPLQAISQPIPAPGPPSVVAPGQSFADTGIEPVERACVPPAVATPPEPSISRERSVLSSAFIGPPPSARRSLFERSPILPDPLSDPSPAQKAYRFDTPGGSAVRPAAAVPASSPAANVPEGTVPGGTSFPPDHAARVQILRRRKSDYPQPNREAEVAGMSRNWKLLSQFEPDITDPLPAHRKGYTRSTDFIPPRKQDEG